ncbi:hypothetical protein HY605_05585 [Candidatus Peregrinibacteria bacterium]|nr:hypothetical protein [Candidatus Peregrinibacteria bacterium]
MVVLTFWDILGWLNPIKWLSWVRKIITSPKAHPNPANLTLVDGIWWGRYKEGAEKQPYCPACVSIGIYTPLTKLSEWVYSSKVGNINFRCPKCGEGYNLTPEHIAEGKKS